jgi:hypothetical protein
VGGPTPAGHSTFHLSTKREGHIADLPTEAYGKLRPTRPGEYLLMGTTRLDVSRWIHSRCGGCKRR